jgi:hypothetical protein
MTLLEIQQCIEHYNQFSNSDFAAMRIPNKFGVSCVNLISEIQRIKIPNIPTSSLPTGTPTSQLLSQPTVVNNKVISSGLLLLPNELKPVPVPIDLEKSIVSLKAQKADNLRILTNLWGLRLPKKPVEIFGVPMFSNERYGYSMFELDSWLTRHVAKDYLKIPKNYYDYLDVHNKFKWYQHAARLYDAAPKKTGFYCFDIEDDIMLVVGGSILLWFVRDGVILRILFFN